MMLTRTVPLVVSDLTAAFRVYAEGISDNSSAFQRREKASTGSSPVRDG